ncbi:MAG: hypothetical protein ORN24_01235, partial [Burkholderiales bacterium]|nr:hypothetical protein [Burkholderiales bacterium]
MKHKINKLVLGLIVGLTLSSTTNALPELNTNSAITLSNLIVGAMGDDDKATTFSVNVTLSTQNIAPLNNWQFGFHQAVSYVKLGNVNPKLDMSICSSSNNCTSLKYLTNPITDKDLSAGYTTILGPSTNYPLLPNTTYTIKLLHNNNWPVVNFSNAPQSFFIATANKFYNLPLAKSQYTFL